ncbi:MAG TPA: formyltransferase family protein [bacterium]|nr:formyltransferase family protein [bacterium]HPN43225.1 formyltransferase family protein [bacterium]
MNYKIALFGLTGFGSIMLQYLLDLGQDIVHVYTREEKIPHPYFPVRSVEDIARQYAIAYSYDRPDHFDETIDLIICASYHRVLPEEILTAPKRGAFNFHPSLLPGYKGAAPTKYSLLLGEHKSGVSLHEMSDKVDSGYVISQYSVEIENYYDDGLLRQQLAELQYPLVLDLFDYLDNDHGFPNRIAGIKECNFPPFQQLTIDLQDNYSIEALSRQLRASSPFPGLRVKLGERYYLLKKFIEFSPGEYDFRFIETGVISIYGADGVLYCVGYRI